MALAPTATEAPNDQSPPAPDTGDEDAAGMDQGAGETVLVTITKNADGTYMVYKGAKPEEGEGDEGAGVSPKGAGANTGPTDTGAGEGGPDEGGGLDAGVAPVGEGGEAAPQGEHCKGVPEALTAAMKILHTDENGGEGAEGAFQAGFGADQGGTPPLAQKY